MLDILVCNGPSRKDFDLNQLDDHNVYGCNIAALEYANVSRSIVIDQPVVDQLVAGGVDRETIILAEGEQQFEPEGKPGGRYKNNAGVFGLQQMIKHGSKKIYVLGMDCLLAEGDFLGNVYLGKENFASKVAFDDQRRRLAYVDWFCQQNPDIKFVFCFPDQTKRFNKMEARNAVGLPFSKLKERLNA